VKILQGKKMPQPQVSVIIPVHNTEAYFPACLESVLAQSLREIEILCVDDASPDQCGRIMDEYARRDARVRPLHRARSGVSGARNAGLAEARGRYVYFMDSDDRISPDFLESFLLSALRNRADLTLFEGMFAGKNPAEVAYCPTLALFARRSLLRDPGLRFPEGVQPAEDALFSHLCLALAGRVGTGGGGTYHYVMHPDQNHRRTARQGPRIVEQLPLCLAALKNVYDRHKLWKRNFSALCRLLAEVFYRDLFVAVEHNPRDRQTYAAVMRAFLAPFRSLPNPELRASFPEGFAEWFEDAGSGPACAPKAEPPAPEKAARVFVADILPPEYDRHAGGRAAWQFNEQLLAAGCRVTFACLGQREGAQRYFAEMRALGIEVVEPAERRNALEDLLRAGAVDFDMALLHRPATGTRFLSLIQDGLGKPVIYFGHDLLFLRREREQALHPSSLPRHDAAAQKEEELALYRKAAIALSPSRAEAELLRKQYGIGPVLVPRLFSYPPPPAPPPGAPRRGLLFVGSAGHTANIDGLRRFLSDVYPRVLRIMPDCPLHIAGFGMRRELFPDLPPSCPLLPDLSEQALAGLYSLCRIFIAPLRFGAGMKGKVLEAMFHGLPVVGSSVAFEGIPDAPPPADEAEDFAAACVALLSDDALWEKRSRLSRRIIERHFSRDEAVAFWRELTGKLRGN
jgi:glycosyltransferase involved in cell wall biosynthesis